MERIRSHGRETYPEECVGALLGRKGEPAHVVSVERIDNIRTAERARRYEISPQDYLRVEGLAAEKSLALLGFYHSHPDHPAAPSAFDLLAENVNDWMSCQDFTAPVARLRSSTRVGSAFPRAPCPVPVEGAGAWVGSGSGPGVRIAVCVANTAAAVADVTTDSASSRLLESSLADAAAAKICCELHHGGKATATISVPGRTCSDSAAIATKLAISNAAAFSQTGHRDVEMVSPRSMLRPYRGDANCW